MAVEVESETKGNVTNLVWDYLNQAPSPAKPVSQEAYSQLAQDDAHHLEVVCGLGPDLTTLFVPAAEGKKACSMHTPLFCDVPA